MSKNFTRLVTETVNLKFSSLNVYLMNRATRLSFVYYDPPIGGRRKIFLHDQTNPAVPRNLERLYVPAYTCTLCSNSAGVYRCFSSINTRFFIRHRSECGRLDFQIALFLSI